MAKTTSWGKFADWYDAHLAERDTYQHRVILPNLLRLMDLKRGETVLDLGCGQGFFSRAFAKLGARVIGVDVSPELIAIAKRESPVGIAYQVAHAGAISFVRSGTVDKAVFVLSLQNIEDAHPALREAGRALKSQGKLFLVLNHPAFRVPKESSWGYDEAKQIQYRRIDRYLSESKVKIEMHPGDRPGEHTISFHRPLQFYVKALRKAGFAVTGLEEWISHKASEPGPRAKAEDWARKEIPLFLCVEAAKVT